MKRAGEGSNNHEIGIRIIDLFPELQKEIFAFISLKELKVLFASYKGWQLVIEDEMEAKADRHLAYFQTHQINIKKMPSVLFSLRKMFNLLPLRLRHKFSWKYFSNMPESLRYDLHFNISKFITDLSSLPQLLILSVAQESLSLEITLPTQPLEIYLLFNDSTILSQKLYPLLMSRNNTDDQKNMIVMLARELSYRKDNGPMYGFMSTVVQKNNNNRNEFCKGWFFDYPPHSDIVKILEGKGKTMTTEVLKCIALAYNLKNNYQKAAEILIKLLFEEKEETEEDESDTGEEE
jgi:hypothetical protein